MEAEGNRLNKQLLVYGTDFFLVSLLTWAFFLIVDPMLVFEDTHVAGGDMISHPWVVKGLKNAWFSGHFWSWKHGWFAGIPFLYFYFYPPYVLALAFDLLGFSEAVAFKLMVFSTIAAVPLVYYLTGRRWLSQPLAFLFSALGMALFFNEFDSRWGGNFKSVLAGQVSHSLGLLATAGFFSYLVKGQTNRKGAILLYGLAILSHVYSALFSTLLLLTFALLKLIEERSLKKLFNGYLVGPFLVYLTTAFWWLPFISYRRYTLAPINNTVVDWSEIIRILQIDNSLYVLIYTGSVGCLLFNLMAGKKRDYYNLTIVLLAVSTVFSLMFLVGTPFLHIRFVSAIYLLGLLSFLLGLRNLRLSLALQWGLVAPLGLLTLQSFLPSEILDRQLPATVRHGVKDGPGWWRWNMSGIEAKPYSQDVLQVWDFLDNVDDPEGRIAVEYGNYNALGSPRIFELTPLFTDKAVMEGLLMESSSVYPSYFYIGLQINPSTWWPGFPVTVPEKNVQKGIDLFSVYNVKYFVAASSAVKRSFADSGQQPLFRNRRFSIYTINQKSRIASILLGNVPVVYSENPLMVTLQHYPSSLENFVEVRPFSLGSRTPWEKVKLDTPQQLIPLNGQWSEDGQTYTVTDTQAAPGNPQNILFKIPYFPNWRSDSGEEMRLVTPNLMMVRTTSPSISIRFSRGWPETLGASVGLLGLILFMMFEFRNSDRVRNN